MMLCASGMERTTVARAVTVARAMTGAMTRAIAVAQTMFARVLVNWFGLRVVAILVR